MIAENTINPFVDDEDDVKVVAGYSDETVGSSGILNFKLWD